MTDTNPLRAEVEQILLAHPRTRYARVLEDMKKNLTDAQLATPSEAEMQAGLYRELLNYRRSPELRQHVTTRLAQLQALDPNVKTTPLGDVRLGANDARRPEKPEITCPDCFLVHSGECY